LLERINSLEQVVLTAVNQLRSDVEQGFRRVERKIELLNNDFLGIRGDQEDLRQRIESLEPKAS
jgi:hypothetical protein